MGRIAVDIMGQRFGRLTVTGRAGRTLRGEIVWSYKCDCGSTGEATGSNIRHGMKGCGCVALERIGALRRTHGETGSALYIRWSGMKQRCLYPKNKRYAEYGGRGITICPEWLDFVTFRDWALTNGFKPRLTLERRENDGNYEPGNCYWATHKAQANNRRPRRTKRQSRTS